MNLNKIKNIVNQRENLKILDTSILNGDKFSNKIRGFAHFLVFLEIFFLPFVLGLFFSSEIGIILFIPVVMLYFLINIIFDDKSNYFHCFSNFLLNKYFNKVTLNNNIKPEHELGKFFYEYHNKKYYKEEQIKKIKSKYDSLNEIEKYFFLNKIDFEEYLHQNIFEYIRNNDVENIKSNKTELIEIILNNLSEKYVDNLQKSIVHKLKQDKKIKKQDFLNIFNDEEEKIVKNNKMVIEI